MPKKCALSATRLDFISALPLRFRRWVSQLGLWWYAYGQRRFHTVWGVASFQPEAVMDLKFRPNFDKIVELLLYLAHVRPGADKYQAVKWFYLADREHLVRYGRPITFDEYYALDYGPVASKTLDILQGNRRVMREAGLSHLPFVTQAGKAYNGSDTIFITGHRRNVDKMLFSKSDLRVFDEIIAKYGKMNFGQLFSITHQHNAYKKAWSARGLRGRGEMDYGDMIGDMVDDRKRQAAIIDDLIPISMHMQ